MNKIIISGIGTEVGKTISSAIITTKVCGDYWKPIQSGSSDTEIIKKLVDQSQHKIFQPVYHFKNPLSPHIAAKLENISIDLEKITPPKTDKTLVIEMAGGILVPLNYTYLTIDLFSLWNASWIIVSKNYLGSINHTLLTIEALQARKIPIKGLIFNGTPDLDSEKAILSISKIPMIGRLLFEKDLNQTVIKRYASKWQL
jgi:dethiobiotin synthetase